MNTYFCVCFLAILMKKTFLLIITWFLFQVPLLADQQSETDSLKKELQTAVDSRRSQILSRLSEILQKTDLQQSIVFDLENLTIQNRLKNRRDASTTLNNLGVSYYMMGNYQQSLGYFEQSLALREEFNDTLNIVKTLNNLGVISQIVGDYEKAVAFLQKSLLFKIALADTLSIAKTLNNIGVVYMDLGKYSDAGKFMKQALDYYQLKKDSSGIAASYNNLGQLFSENKMADSALAFYALSLEIKRKIGDRRGIGNTLNNMGMIYFEKKQNDKAVNLFEEAREIRTQLGDNFGLSSTLNNLANLYFTEKTYPKAIEFFRKSLEIAEAENLKGILQRNYAGLAQLFDETGRTADALKYYKLLNSIKDSLYKEDINKQLADLNLKYQTEKSKKENELLKRENQIQELKLNVSEERQKQLYFVILLLIAIGVAAFMIMQNRNNRRMNDQLHRLNQELEVKVALRTAELAESNNTKDQLFSIIAHDLKSPFNSLLGLTELLSESFDTLTEEEKKEFIKYTKESVENLYRLLENLLNWSLTQTGKLQLNPEPLKMDILINDTLNLFYQQSQKKSLLMSVELETTEMAFADEETIKTVLRNLVSNAIKFTPIGGKVTVNLSMINNPETGKMLQTTVNDTGVGIPPEKQQILFESPRQVKSLGTSYEKGTGLGLLLCKEFVEKNHGRISIFSEPDNGSSFAFTLPVYKNQAS